MARPAPWILGGVLAFGGAVLLFRWWDAKHPEATQLWKQFDGETSAPELRIQHPMQGAVFPAENLPLQCRWDDPSGADVWRVRLTTPAGASLLSEPVSKREWSPDFAAWGPFQGRAKGKEITLTVVGWRRSAPAQLLARGQVRFCVSEDVVGAPLFYREVILPFIDAVKDPARLRWRFGSIASAQPPPVVLEGMPVCGNCHSFPQDGRWLAMDVDYANSKGSYTITPVAREMTLTPEHIITWDDYRRGDGDQTFGFLSQISPNGEVVISTVKDRSVFVPRPNLEFSQLFFPIKGILVFYRRESRTYQALPGADDPAYVQSNPTWSPDGQYLVFARAPAYELKKPISHGRALLTAEECEEFLKEGKPFQFDLYRIPFNGGQGGTAEPLPGASANGRSNFFPRYSPDGKWIVFCQARNYMLLQPDSELFIIPAQGGTPRRLACNLSRMNSWHTWSPNSRWLVFSSKANSPYTQLFLAHIDPQGNAAPPVCLAHLTAADRAANIPEFVPLDSQAIRRITVGFLDAQSHARAGFTSETVGEIDRAIQEYHAALELEPNNPHAHERLGFIYLQLKNDTRRGLAHCRRAIELDARNGQAHFILGRALLQQGQLDSAIQELRAALRLFPSSVATDPEYHLPGVHRYLGMAFLFQGDPVQSTAEFRTALALDANNAETHQALALALARQGLIEETLVHFNHAIRLKPSLRWPPEIHEQLARNYARAGQFEQATEEARKALALLGTQGSPQAIRRLQDCVEAYERQQLPPD